MDQQENRNESEGITRRSFLGSVAAAGVGLAVSRAAFGQEPGEQINVALLGSGSQGRALMMACLKIPNIRFKAVCDIWKYHQKYAKNILKKYKQDVNVYEDYREMLASERDLDAVLIATPDWVHSEHTVACLEAGKHVYCEKEMARTIEGARKMVQASQRTGKLLQIGHQRRSNPRYKHAMELIQEQNVLGRITHTYGQWNRAKMLELGWPEKYTIDDATLQKYGYQSMERFRNWRWYKQYSGGAIADLGSHQVDIFSWFLDTDPTGVMATGGLDYYKDREWYDNVMAFYEYQTKKGPVRSFYQVLNTTSYGGYYEVFMGDAGSLQISEDTRVGFFYREVSAKPKEWMDMSEKVESMGTQAIELKVGETRAADGKQTPEALKMQEDAQKPVHQPHLENFFDAMRGKTKLTCPGEVAFETTVPILRTNEAVAAGRRIELAPSEYKV